MPLPHLRQAMLVAGERRVAHRALSLENRVREQLSSPGTGREYKRGSVVHRASAPGASPAADLGELRRRTNAVQISRFHWRVGTNLEYAIVLEYGSRTIEPRPFMRPALAAERASPEPSQMVAV